MEHTGKRALVLAGGGAKGSYQIGVWRALQALDWTPDIITGASVGTLNGCLFTMGKIQEAEDLWRGLEIHDVLEIPETLKPDELRPFFLDIIRSGGLNVEPLTETIDRLIDEDAVRTSPIHFGLVMTELGSLRSVQCPIEDIPLGQLKDYMLASSACFPALRPREIDGVKYIDGGWRDNMPLDLAAAMGAALPDSRYTEWTLDRPYYGLYYGYAALPMEPDHLTYLTSDLLDACTVYNYETGKTRPIYDLAKGAGKDPYELFLSGSVSLLTIENPNADTDRELVIFRDSFGSSLAPLLVPGYAKVTLADIRYLPSSQMGKHLTFTDQDVLFLYSAPVLNNSETLK